MYLSISKNVVRIHLREYAFTYIECELFIARDVKILFPLIFLN